MRQRYILFNQFVDGFPDPLPGDYNETHHKPGEAALVYNAAPGVFFTGADMVCRRCHRLRN